MPKPAAVHANNPYTGRAAKAARRGASSIEFALVAIPLFTFIFASLEFGHGMLVVQSVEEAARCGCRTAALKDKTAADVDASVDEVMSTLGISAYTTDVQPVSFSSLPQWDPVSVSVSLNFADVSLLPLPKFLATKVYTATCSLPREATPD